MREKVYSDILPSQLALPHENLPFSSSSIHFPTGPFPLCRHLLSFCSRPTNRLHSRLFHGRVYSGNASLSRKRSRSGTVFHTLYREQERRKRVLGWRRTHKDPFEGEWEQILSWLVANPERSIGDIFRELQRRSPGRYQPLQIRTLQRGMRKIRAHLLQTLEEHASSSVRASSTSRR